MSSTRLWIAAAAAVVLGALSIVFLALWLVEKKKVLDLPTKAWTVHVNACRDVEGKDVTCGVGKRRLDFQCPEPDACGPKPDALDIDCVDVSSCTWLSS